MTAIVNLDVHGRHADCCLTVHGPGLLDNRRLFLDRQRERERGGKGGERLREMAGENRDEAEREKRRRERKGDRIDNRATPK